MCRDCDELKQLDPFKVPMFKSQKLPNNRIEQVEHNGFNDSLAKNQTQQKTTDCSKTKESLCVHGGWSFKVFSLIESKKCDDMQI